MLSPQITNGQVVVGPSPSGGLQGCTRIYMPDINKLTHTSSPLFLWLCLVLNNWFFWNLDAIVKCNFLPFLLIGIRLKLWWCPHMNALGITNGRSALIQTMVWCCEATISYMNQWWSRSMSTYRVIRPQCVNFLNNLVISVQYVQRFEQKSNLKLRSRYQPWNSLK